MKTLCVSKTKRISFSKIFRKNFFPVFWDSRGVIVDFGDNEENHNWKVLINIIRQNAQEILKIRIFFKGANCHE